MSIDLNLNNLNGFAISTEMFEWIRTNIKEGSTILELGSGNGTIELSKWYNVYSIEQNKKWVGVAKNSTYIYAPIKNGWYDTEIVFNNLPENYALLIIDGPTGISRNKMKEYWGQFNTNIPILVDDTHRGDELLFAQTSSKELNKEIETIQGHQKSFSILR